MYNFDKRMCNKLQNGLLSNMEAFVKYTLKCKRIVE